MNRLNLVALVLLTAPLTAQQYPTPTPAQQKTIDYDVAQHIGDSPVDAGPLARDLSPALNPKAIDKAIRKVADWELARSQPYFGDTWTWSALYTGFLAASDATGDPKYRDAMLAMSDKFNWKLRSKTPNADDQSIAQTYVALYEFHPDSSHLAPTQTTLDNLLPLKTLTATDPRIPWWWCDALFMAPPVWSHLYHITGDVKYLDYLDENWHKTSTLLYDPEEHLYARDAGYLARRGPNGKKIFWSRGNGWVMAGIVRILEDLPANDPHRAFYVTQLQQMSARIAQLQQPDGLWHASLLDSADYPLPEISGSAFFTYALAYGINHHILDARTYRPIITRSWRGLLHHVYANGRLGCIQQTGAEPAFYLPTASYNYGIGAYLLAASELKILAGN